MSIPTLLIPALNPVGPTIIVQPTNQLFTEGQSVSFTAEASGVPTPTIQWQISTNSGVSFTNIYGATSTTYTYLAYAQNTVYKFIRYRAVFTNSDGSVISDVVTATLKSAPLITLHPDNRTFTDGQSITLKAEASGVPFPTVQWQRATIINPLFVSPAGAGTNFTNISGATSTTYTFTAHTSDNTYQYRAIFTNSVGSTTSKEVSIFLNRTPINYYVSTTGSNSNPGTFELPWKTVRYACAQYILKPGDIINIRGGIYKKDSIRTPGQGSINNGTLECPITVQPYQNEIVTIIPSMVLSDYPEVNGWEADPDHSGLYRFFLDNLVTINNEVFAYADKTMYVRPFWAYGLSLGHVDNIGFTPANGGGGLGNTAGAKFNYDALQNLINPPTQKISGMYEISADMAGKGMWYWNGCSDTRPYNSGVYTYPGSIVYFRPPSTGGTGAGGAWTLNDVNTKVFITCYDLQVQFGNAYWVFRNLNFINGQGILSGSTNITYDGLEIKSFTGQPFLVGGNIADKIVWQNIYANNNGLDRQTSSIVTKTAFTLKRKTTCASSVISITHDYASKLVLTITENGEVIFNHTPEKTETIAELVTILNGLTNYEAIDVSTDPGKASYYLINSGFPTSGTGDTSLLSTISVLYLDYYKYGRSGYIHGIYQTGVSNCIFRNNYYGDVSGEWLSWRGGNNNLIYNNVVHQTHGGFLDLWDTDTKVVNNLMYTGGLDCNGNGISTSFSHGKHTILNNTIIYDKIWDTMIIGPTGGLSDVIKNNIIKVVLADYPYGNYPYLLVTGGSYSQLRANEIDNNLWHVVSSDGNLAPTNNHKSDWVVIWEVAPWNLPPTTLTEDVALNGLVFHVNDITVFPAAPFTAVVCSTWPSLTYEYIYVNTGGVNINNKTLTVTLGFRHYSGTPAAHATGSYIAYACPGLRWSVGDTDLSDYFNHVRSEFGWEINSKFDLVDPVNNNYLPISPNAISMNVGAILNLVSKDETYIVTEDTTVSILNFEIPVEDLTAYIKIRNTSYPITLALNGSVFVNYQIISINETISIDVYKIKYLGIIDGLYKFDVFVVSSSLIITLQPSNQTISTCEIADGKSVSFVAEATGSIDITVQWQISIDNGVTFLDILGATSSTYTFMASISNYNNKYRAIFTNGDSSISTNIVNLNLIINGCLTLMTQVWNPDIVSETGFECNAKNYLPAKIKSITYKGAIIPPVTICSQPELQKYLNK